MGYSRFDGPVYGAKQTLVSFRQAPISTGVAWQTKVPPGEDWFVTELTIDRTSTGSTVYGTALLDDSTVVSSAAISSSLASQSTNSVIAADSGEAEGAKIASGSVVTVTLNSTGLDATVTVRGYPRWINSTRAF